MSTVMVSPSLSNTVSFQPSSQAYVRPRPPVRDRTWKKAPCTCTGCGSLPLLEKTHRSVSPNGTVNSTASMS